MGVKIDIPGIGVVDADNAASEETLRAILTAMDASSGKRGKADKAAEDAANARADADKKAAKGSKDFNVGMNSAADGAIKALKNIGLTAVSLVTNFATNFANIANNPIQETAKMLDTLIDGVAKTTTSLTDAIPVVGGFISAMLNATAELAKAANKTFADQLQKNIDALQAYNKVGVSFAGGMNQMNKIAHSAGLGIEDFSKIVTKSKQDLNFLGLSGAGAATALSNGLGLSAKMIGKSGQSLRNEMFKLGYNYEEQGEVMASYMANMQAAGKLESMTRGELAQGTRQYAADLKVVADFTGQDAKKLADRARQAQMNVAIQQTLDKDQRDRFGKTTQMLARMGPEGERAQQALTQMLLRGATNVSGYTMGPGREMIETMMKNVKSGQEDVFQNAGRAMSKAQEQTNKERRQGDLAAAKAFTSLGEAGDGMISFQTGINAMGKIGPEMISNMQDANKKQANNKDKALDQTAALYDQTKKQQVEMEILVNSHMEVYAGLLKEVNDALAGNFMKFIKGANGGKGPTKEEVQQQVKKEGYKSNAEGIGAPSTIFLKQEDETQEAYAKRMTDYANARNKAAADAKKAESGDWQSDYMKSVTKHDKGGTIGAGRLGIAGENGPELISGPASILSTAATEKLITALDAMREMSGNRFGESGLNQQVGMSGSRMAKLKDRAKGFEDYDYKQLQSELEKRPENAPIQAVKDQWDREERGDTSMAEATTQLVELVRLMKQNVSYSARVAANTN